MKMFEDAGSLRFDLQAVVVFMSSCEVDLLAVSDAKIIGVALEALENILKARHDLWPTLATVSSRL